MACTFSTDCPDCGDKMIHQENRGFAESSSGYGNHIRDHRTKKQFFMDVDGVLCKMANGMVRIIEHKKPGRPLKKSQLCILPILQKGIELLIDRGEDGLHKESGVFVVRSEPPWDCAEVTSIKTGETVVMDADLYKRFEECEPIAGILKGFRKMGGLWVPGN